jgi:tetratricopeptide (TPR) repeat protein
VKDRVGLEVSGADAAALDLHEQALGGLQRFTGDPVGLVNSAIALRPEFAMAHALKGWLYGLSTEASARRVASACAQAAARHATTARERGHARALGLLAAGNWHAAGAALEDLTIEHPRDALALQAGHQIDFFTGNARILRERIARALPAWDRSMPGYHAILAMHAFGLEENGDYARAEAQGRRAIELEPRDGWARHAVAHVMEMQGRHADGIAWMRGSVEDWTGDSFLKVHNWWHLALYHYELGDHQAVLALYDGPIHGDGSGIALALVDASAILWRLHLAGADCGGRWAALAEEWAPLAGRTDYAFNDAHAMMAFVGAGRSDLAGELLGRMREAATATAGDNAGFTRDVGLPLAEAVLAFGNGDHHRAVALLRPLRAIAHRFGGSHAQRDVIDLTLAEAAIRSGNAPLATALAAERADLKPESPLSAFLAQRAAAAGHLLRASN